MSNVVEIRKLSKQFPGVDAVIDVDLDIAPAEVHAIAGENGAGKSTLMRMLAQRERPSAGDIYVAGERVSFHGPRDAQRLGIAMVHQELALFPHLSVADNLALAFERSFWLRRGDELAEARALLEQVGLDVNPRRLVSSLSVGEQQLLEIAKAVAVEAKIVIMDEPTATLGAAEIEVLFSVIERLRQDGAAVLYVTHRLDEIFRLADSVTVMRDGRLVQTLPTRNLGEHRLVELMVGRKLENLYAKPDIAVGQVVLSARGLSRAGVLDDCSLTLRAGEIVGLAGMVGAGRSELARAIFGAEPAESGTIELDGRRIAPRSPSDAIRAGITYLTEDRKRDGLLLNRSVAENITLARIPRRRGVLNVRHEEEIAARHVAQLRIRTTSTGRPVRLLSGGSQQKVLAARALETDARVLIFDEPARGIDIGAKAELFALIAQLAEQGRAILMISSYLPELLNMCDRIVVMRDGRTVSELQRSEFSEVRIGAIATGARVA
ncbi:MAG TPA: sugar ABC transporter ATP-binding protein [Gaiellaceae bacterium]|jgi:ABC-type sugar transport system ATPase subunit